MLATIRRCAPIACIFQGFLILYGLLRLLPPGGLIIRLRFVDIPTPLLMLWPETLATINIFGWRFSKTSNLWITSNPMEINKHLIDVIINRDIFS